MKEEYARMVRRTLRADTSRTAPPVTADSIARAKQHQADERQRVYELTKVRITDAGLEHPAVIVHCTAGGCGFTSSAQTIGRALRSLAPHLVLKHGWSVPVEGK